MNCLIRSRCGYNPENPSEAFLLENPAWIFWIAVAAGIVALIWGLQQTLALIVDW